MKQRRTSERRSRVETIGRLVVRFQAGTAAVDRTAAEVLALDPQDLAALSALWFAGPKSASELARALDVTASVLRASIDRLELAGYVLRRGDRIDLAQHARRWIETLWGPLEREGEALCQAFSARALDRVARFLDQACAAQERHVARLRALLELPARARASNRAKGGLTPAALRRVELFVEANLGDTLRIADLARRAGLSEFHFARAFKASAGATPRAFIEARRVERARALIQGTDLPLAQVAVEAGFGSQSRLTTAFRRATGVTPARLRRSRTPEGRGEGDRRAETD